MKTLLKLTVLLFAGLHLMMGGCKIAEQTAQVETENAPVPGLVSPPQVESQSLSPQDQVQLIPPVVEAPIAEGAVIAETPVEVVANQSITIIGTIHYVELEGGFFGIVTQEGSKYFPQYLTSEFKVDGLPVRVEAMPEKQIVGIQMWGAPITILSIESI